MMFVSVRMPYENVEDVSRVGAQLGATFNHYFTVDDASLIVWFHFQSEEEAVRAVALAVLAGYDAWTEPVPP